MKCPYVRLEYNNTYNQWYGFDEFGTNTTISHDRAENYKRIIPFTIVSSPDVYQQRLEKLLKHFKKDSEIHYTYVVKKSLEIWYNVEIEKFYIGYQMGFGRIEIPFKAVEVWINSLEDKENA